MSQQSFHRIDSTDSFTSQPRVSSSHGVIRGSTVRLTAGVSGGAIGRLHGTIPAPPPAIDSVGSGDPRPTSSRSGGNYFGVVSRTAPQVSLSLSGGETPPGRSTAQAGGGMGSSSDFSWDQGTFHGRVTLSRSGRRADQATPSYQQPHALVSSPSFAGDVPSAETEVAMQRRESLISSALGRRPSQTFAVTPDQRTADLLQKQDSLRLGSRPSTSDGRGLASSRGSFAAAAAAAGDGDSNGQQRRGSGFESRTVAIGHGISPRNPLSERRMSSVSTSAAAVRQGHTQLAAVSVESSSSAAAEQRREEGIGPMAAARCADDSDKDAASLSKMWCCA